MLTKSAVDGLSHAAITFDCVYRHGASHLDSPTGQARIGAIFVSISPMIQGESNYLVLGVGPMSGHIVVQAVQRRKIPPSQ